MLKSLGFSSDGRLLALGSEEGGVEIREWPELQVAASWQASPDKAIRFVDFSDPHGNGILFTTDESGAACLWNTDDGEKVTQLSAPEDMPRATFFRCQAARDARGIAIYTAVKWKGGGHILRWRQADSGEIVLEARTAGTLTATPICGFSASPSGALLGVVTPDGDQLVVDAGTLKLRQRRPKGHMTFATAVTFSPNERLVLSVSADASALLTPISKVHSDPQMLLLLQALIALVIAFIVWVSLVYYNEFYANPTKVE